MTAAQHAANEDYYRVERDKLAARNGELLAALERANNHLFDSIVDDVEHQITSHADTLPETLRRIAAGHAAAFAELQVIVHEMVDPEPPIGMSGAFSEDLYNEDGSAVTIEQARERAGTK